MAVHDVTIDLPTRELGKTDVHFVVRQDGDILGKLEVSRGAIVWYPKNKTLGHKLTWTDLDKIAVNFPKSEKRKKR